MRGSVIVVGAGHNGLVAACQLAREGFAVQVFEALPEPGGLCAGAEFAPGARHEGVLHHSATLRPWVVEALKLEQHGLLLRDRPVPWTLNSGPVPQQGSAPWEFAEAVAPTIRGFLDAPAPKVGRAAVMPLLQRGIAMRSMGASRLKELIRCAVLPIETWLVEQGVPSEVRAAMALPALLGTFMGPLSPHSAGVWLVRHALAAREVVGGPARLFEVLADVARYHGVRIACDQPVGRIRVERGQVRGVVLANGDAVDASRVISCLDPRRTLLDLVPAHAVPPGVEDEVRCHRHRATSAKLHLALSVAPTLRDGQRAPAHLCVTGGPLQLERAFDAAKHGRLPSEPALDVRLAPVRAESGPHIASVHVFGVPHTPRDGWSADARERLLEAALARLELALPGVRDLMTGHELLTPRDLETRFGVSGGHAWHGEIALDQLWSLRPGPELSRHATPIAGLFLASGGVHPLGGVSGAPGALCARAVLEARSAPR
ncbi:MAG: NAD(P)/FAD-dependent oxidoreductase [Myxococcales bacterium]|nr:NAD(P)/FAD-dependent oxidoreductase [Myxococcales bacterium]